MMRRFCLLGGLLLWLAVIAAGFHALRAYEATPGVPTQAPKRCPSTTLLTPLRGRPLLIMFAHPRCPCTRASLNELARLMVKLRQPVSARVLFAAPSGGGTNWTRTDLWTQAAAIPGVQPHLDPDGLLAHRFGASTSGQVLLYSTDGRLLFQGGITAARGHEGDNNGSAAILALIAQRDMARAQMQTSVFGCPLYRHIRGVSGKAAATCSP